MKSFVQYLTEQQPLRKTNPHVEPWIAMCRARSDWRDLYMHGSPALFTKFKQPDTSRGQLLFFSQLDDFRPDETLQAEYYGDNLYLCKLAKGKLFDPLNDKHAREIHEQAISEGTFDRDRKLKWGRVDYQDLHAVVPLAVKAGYNRFQVFEVAVSRYSHAVTDPQMITIIDVYRG